MLTGYKWGSPRERIAGTNPLILRPLDTKPKMEHWLDMAKIPLEFLTKTRAKFRLFEGRIYFFYSWRAPYK
jgi:hypothetical protein